MGCWNGTCALTHLPIHDGERVVVHIVTSHKFGWNSDFGGGFVAANTHANPIGPALRGAYNGYGGVEDIDGQALGWWTAHLDELKPYLTDYLGYGDDEDEEDGESLSFASMEDFINNESGIERGELYISPLKAQRMEDFRPQMRLGIMLCHEDAYERFMATGIASDDWLFDDKNEDPVTHYVKDLKKRLATLARTPGKLPVGYRRDDPYGRLGLDGELVMRSIHRYVKAHKDKGLLEEVARLRIFDMMLEAARKSWGVQCGAGSGYSDTALQVTLARFTLEHAGESA